LGPDERKRVMNWESIKRTGKPDPHSVDERTGTTRIVLHVPISASPAREWRKFFESRHPGHDYPPLSIQEAEIIVLALDSEEDFVMWTENVDKDIQLANEYYMTDPRRETTGAERGPTCGGATAEARAGWHLTEQLNVGAARGKRPSVV
jgi:hypothetical protein